MSSRSNCAVCRQKLFVRNMKCHMKKHMTTLQLWRCKLCDRELSSKYSLSRHHKTRHPERTTAYELVKRTNLSIFAPREPSTSQPTESVSLTQASTSGLVNSITAKQEKSKLEFLTVLFSKIECLARMTGTSSYRNLRNSIHSQLNQDPSHE